MPQPLLSVTNGKPINYIGRLPLHEPQICALAMAVIAEWSNLESAVLKLVTTLSPGRAEPIADLYVSYNAASPKRAMLDALAKAAMSEEELVIFEKLKVRHASAYKCRNPLAHWVLGHSPEVPGHIVAIDSRVLNAQEAKTQDDTSRIIRDALNGRRAEVQTNDVVERLSEFVSKAQAYSEIDLNAIISEISKTARLFLSFQFYLNWRIHGFHPARQPQLWTELLQDLK